MRTGATQQQLFRSLQLLLPAPLHAPQESAPCRSAWRSRPAPLHPTPHPPAERSVQERVAQPPLEELRERCGEVRFGAALCGLTILRYLTDHAPKLSLSVLTRIVSGAPCEGREGDQAWSCCSAGAWSPAHAAPPPCLPATHETYTPVLHTPTRPPPPSGDHQRHSHGAAATAGAQALAAAGARRRARSVPGRRLAGGGACGQAPRHAARWAGGRGRAALFLGTLKTLGPAGTCGKQH